MTAERRMPASLLIERILSTMTILGMACLCLGAPLYLIGKASDAFAVAQLGVYISLIGIALLVMRAFFWILETIVGRGLESMER